MVAIEKPYVVFLGLRGFPDVQGGVETHAEHLCPLLVELGCKVDVITRSPYQPSQHGASWQGVNFKSLWSPKSKGLEAIVHTFLGVMYAGVILRPDILHIQAIGPAIMTPLARLLGLKVVVTHHGPDYDRQKWGRAAKGILQLGERWGMRFANARVVISDVIRRLVQDKHHKESALIPNGVDLPALPETTDILQTLGLTPKKYILLVSRMVPEKRHLDLIEAFRLAKLPDWQLVLVGAADHPDMYTKKVLHTIENTPGTIAAGFQSGKNLDELYAHAGLFVLPSSHEGLPIAMLEALSFGLPVIASDIPANLEVGLPSIYYFPLGDRMALSAKLQKFAAYRLTSEERESRRAWVVERYNWRTIAAETFGVYQKLV